jgi:hypothetical protein
MARGSTMKRLLLIAFVGVLLSGPWTSAGEPSGARELTVAEHKAVSELAEKILKDRDLWKGKIYLTNVEVVLDHQPKPPQRYALLLYYRYEGDLGIRVTVHVGKMTVTDVQTHAHMPVSLTLEELAEAEKIARAHPDVKKALAKYSYLDKIEIDAMVAHIVQPDVPGYQHRVIRLFFRDAQRKYLQHVPMVDVDLTTGEVRLDLMVTLHKKG